MNLTQTHDLFKKVTPTEIEVVRLLAAGKSNKEIAEEFGRSVRTIEGHKYHALTRTGFRTMEQLVAEMLRCGVIA